MYLRYDWDEFEDFLDAAEVEVDEPVEVADFGIVVEEDEGEELVATAVAEAANCLTEIVGLIALEGCHARIFSSRKVRGSPERRQSAYTRPLRIRLISILRWVNLPD